MQRNILFSAITIALLLGGCEDKSEIKTSVQGDKQVHAQEKVVEDSVMQVQKAHVKTVPVQKDEVTSVAAVASAVTSAQIAKSVSAVERAQAHASVEITGAVAAVETGELEDDEGAHMDANALSQYQKEAQMIIQEEVYKVEAAKAASSAKIAASVKSVMDARAASFVRDPLPASVLSVVKAKASSAVAKSISTVEIVKAHASTGMAKATAKVEMHKRIYGEGSPEVKSAKAEASGIIAHMVGTVKVAEAKALGTISESVAEVEVAKVKAGVPRHEVVKGQKIYLNHLKKICGINGAKFAAKHTQQEWESLNEAGSFVTETQKICPNIQSLEPAWIKNLFEFSYEYASDSGHVPSCG